MLQADLIQNKKCYYEDFNMYLKGIVLVIVQCGVAFAQPSVVQAGPNAQRLLATRRIELELHLKRIIPAEVTVEEGLYEIRLINTAFTGNLQLVIDTEGNNQRVGDKAFDGKSAKVRPVFDLKPGRHIASIAGRPELRAVLIVTRKL